MCSIRRPPIRYNTWGPSTLRWTTGTAPKVHAASMERVGVTVAVRNTGTRVGGRPILLFVQRLAGTGSGTHPSGCDTLPCRPLC